MIGDITILSIQKRRLATEMESMLLDLLNSYALAIEKTVKFIYRNFGGNPNDYLPYCVVRDGKPWQICGNFTPTQLAARTTYMNDEVLNHHNQRERNAGKLQAYIEIGGDPELKDSYGNTSMALAKNAGSFPGSHGDGLDFGKLLAGAAVVVTSGYMASEGAYEQAAEFLTGGLTDVATGQLTNLERMQKEQRKQTEASEEQLLRHIQVLAEKTYITPTNWASVSGAPLDESSTGQPGQKQSTQSSHSSPKQKSETASIEGMDMFTFTCPASGKTHSLPIPPLEGECLEAAKRMAKTTSCNMIDEYPEATKAYYKACEQRTYE